jgi:hypothetical protein
MKVNDFYGGGGVQMEFGTVNVTFSMIGSKYTGRFEDYPTLIPQAKEGFLERYKRINGDGEVVRAILYEPKKGADHEVAVSI